MIVTDRQVTSWLETAVQGDVLPYARATSLPHGSRVAERLRDLAASGVVVLYRQRRLHGGGDENFHYYARRTGKQFPRAGGSQAGGRAASPLPATKPQDKRMGVRASVALEIVPQVRALLAEGEPRNAAAIARKLGIYSPTPVHKALQRLAA